MPKVTLTHPDSSLDIEVEKDNAATYESQGWAEKPKK